MPDIGDELRGLRKRLTADVEFFEEYRKTAAAIAIRLGKVNAALDQTISRCYADLERINEIERRESSRG